MSKYKSIEAEVCEWYQKGEPVKDIIEAHGLANDAALYYILKKHNIPTRKKPTANGHEAHSSAPVKPSREWFLIDECARIVNMSCGDIEWLIRKGAVHADTGETATGGKFTLVYLPSLMDASKHAGIDGKRAKQLLNDAWTLLDKLSYQRAIDIDDVKVVCAAIREFFVQNGWKV